MKLFVTTVLILLLFCIGHTQNYVLTFDGNNDYVNLGNDAGDDIRTIELWFKPNIDILPNNSTRYTLVTRNSDDQNGEFGIFIGYNFLGERGRVTFTRQVGSTFYYVYSDQNSWEADKWYHVAGVINPLEGMKLYIDGVLQQDTDPSTQPTESENEITNIGCWGNNMSRWFDGEIDELRFYDRALTESEINEHMCDTIDPQNTVGLVGYWPMNEGGGTSLYDFSGQGNHGTIHGAKYEQISVSFSYVKNGLFVQFSTPVEASSYFWEFGDGTISTEKNPAHNYSVAGIYNVCLTVPGICDELTDCKEINLCVIPQSSFEYIIDELNVQFTSMATGTEYFWDFGDGDVSTEINPVHIYDTVGSYNVCLTVTNICGSDILCQDIEICLDPVSNYAYGISGFDVSFVNQASHAEDFQWDFGDGSHSIEENPVHTYADFGIYYTSLSVFNACGTDQHRDTLYLLAPMMCNFSFIVDEFGSVQFQDESIDAYSCFWDFGDGVTSTEQNPIHKYQDNGSYNCCLTIENEVGKYTFCDTVLIESYPEPVETINIYYSPACHCLKIEVPEDGTYEIILYDIGGNPAFSNKFFIAASATFELGVSSLPAGVYIIQLSSANIFKRQKTLITDL